MANIDISSKLSHEPQTITIAEGKTYEVDCGAETMLKAQDLFKKDDSLEGLFKAIELLLGKEALEEIKETGASFRSKYIVDTIGKVNAAIEAKNNETLNEELQQFDLEYIKSLPTDECHKALQNFMGVGAKVADCIMLFSMAKKSAFPVDVWIKRAMIHFYLAPDVSLNKIRVFGRDKFGELSGMAQQYLFYYAREINIKVE